MVKGYIYDPDPNGNHVLETETEYARRKFKFNQELFLKCLKETWRDRVLHISLLMDHRVRRNFLRASKRRQKKMIEHMRGFLIRYHATTGKLAPCTQKHNGPYIAKNVMLVEQFYPTTIYDPEKFKEYYAPKECEVTLCMHFNDPERKPDIIPYTMGNMKRVMGIDPSLTGLPDVVWLEENESGNVKIDTQGFRVKDLQACCAIPLDPKTTKE